MNYFSCSIWEVFVVVKLASNDGTVGIITNHYNVYKYACSDHRVVLNRVSMPVNVEFSRFARAGVGHVIRVCGQLNVVCLTSISILCLSNDQVNEVVEEFKRDFATGANSFH